MKKTSVKDKKAAVAALEKGESFLKIRKKYKVNPVTIKQWWNEYSTKHPVGKKKSTKVEYNHPSGDKITVEKNMKSDTEIMIDIKRELEDTRQAFIDSLVERFRRAIRNHSGLDLKDLHNAMMKQGII